MWPAGTPIYWDKRKFNSHRVGLGLMTTVATISYFKPDSNVMPRVKTVCIYKHIAGALNDGFLSNALKTLFNVITVRFK